MAQETDGEHNPTQTLITANLLPTEDGSIEKGSKSVEKQDTAQSGTSTPAARNSPATRSLVTYQTLELPQDQPATGKTGVEKDSRRITKMASEKKGLKAPPRKGLAKQAQAPKHFKSDIKTATVTQIGNQLIVTASKDF